MATWFAAHNYTPTDVNSLQAIVPFEGAYTDLVTGDMAFVYLNGQMDVFVYDSTSSATQNIPAIVTSDGNAGNGRWIRKEMSQQWKGGWETLTGPAADAYATMSVSGTTFTLTFVSEYSFFVKGVKYTVSSGNKTVEITDVEGVHWIYFDDTGTLSIVAPGAGSTKTLISETCLVAGVYWDATNNQAIFLFDERHGAGMSPATHLYLHDVYGAVYETGLGFTGFDVNGSGDDATAAQFDLEAGEFHDEDNEIEISADTDITIPTFYKSGVGGAWRKLEATATYPVADGTIGDRLDWNDYNGGDWQLLEVTNNDFVCTHYFATNDANIPIIGVMGETIYANANQARTGAETEILDITYNGLPLTEFIILGSVIWQTSDGYSNQVQARVRSTDEGDDYIDWRQVRSLNTGGGSTNDHEALDNLLGGAVGDHYHLTSGQHTDLTDSGATTLHNHIPVATTYSSDTDLINTDVSTTFVKLSGVASCDVTRWTPVEGVQYVITCTDVSVANPILALSAGITYDGTNGSATFNAVGETLVVFAVSSTRVVIVENIGAVGLS